jgi:excisionase family DNA binding protein
MKPYLTIKQTAALLGHSEGTIRNWIKIKKLKASQPWRIILIAREDINLLIADSIIKTEGS